MPLVYSPAAKAARMEATAAMMEGGAIELGTTGMATVLARIPLPANSVEALGDTITCTPQEGTFALAKGRAAVARVVDAKGGEVIEPTLTVGKKNADVTLDYPDLVKGQVVTVESMSLTHA